MKKEKGILVVSYGSSYKEEREKSIGGIEQAIAEAFSEYKIYRAFTSESIIERIWKKEGYRVDTIGEALQRALADGVRKMVIIQTHLVKGIRYEAMEQAVASYNNQFEELYVVQPVLSVENHIEAFAQGLASIGNTYDDGRTAVCFVGHGIDEDTGTAYHILQQHLNAKGHGDFYIGTLSMYPTRTDIVECIQAKAVKQRIVLVPLMLVSGYHVRKDLAGVSENSWMNTFKRAGYDVECVKKGLGEEKFVQNMFVDHLKNVIL